MARERKTTGFVVASLLTAMAAIVFQEPTSAGPKSDGWTLFLTGDTRGYLHPCGCDEGLFGGVARRATVLSQKKVRHRVLVDLGNLITGTRAHHKLKLRYLLRALKQLGYDALVPGHGELAMGGEFERLIDDLDVDVVCANVTLRESGKSLFEPYKIIKAGRTRVAIVGIVEPSAKHKHSRYAVRPPSEALRTIVREIGTRADAIVVAGYLSGVTAVAISREFPTVSLVAGSNVPRGTKQALKRGGVPIMLAANRAQYVAWVQFASGNGVVASGQQWLGDDVADDPKAAALVAAHDKAAAQLGTAFSAETRAAMKRSGFVGSSSCKECHEQEYSSWKHSKHSHAVAVLRTKSQARNPNCLDCHMRDYSAKQQVADGVGCEACHGPGSLHVAARRTGRADVYQTPVRESSCLKCHDSANSPKFKFEAYWPRIIHGAK